MLKPSRLITITICLLFATAAWSVVASYCEKHLSIQDEYRISKLDYKDKLEGFWLTQNIANWTGLITEMDKIGNIGAIKTGAFYTRKDWGGKEQPNIWGEDKTESISPTIDFVIKSKGEIWGADDDTDIEYMYQQLLFENKTSFLTPSQIQKGWLKHIKKEEENFLWVSNQQAYNLMAKGILPPETSLPENNQFYNMIDAQLTTEIFGLYAPGNPQNALKMAELPIRTTAFGDAEYIAKFYVVMHALAGKVDTSLSMKEQLQQMANEAREILPDTSYARKMYDYVLAQYQSGIPWEAARDSIYIRYQVNQMDGYDISSKNLHCNGCFAAGINFSASLVSLFYGEGNLKETIKIGVLTGWDSDNPTATWGGLLGFMLGKKKVESLFGGSLSNQFNIHRTRQNFDNNGIDSFENMAAKGCEIVERVVLSELNGKLDSVEQTWVIPINNLQE